MSQPSHSDSAAVVRDAATVVLLRDASGPSKGDRPLQVLLLRRHRNLVFGGGAEVFPGGAVDAADATLTATRMAPLIARDRADRWDARWRVAALRECFEEAGLLLAAGPIRDAGTSLSDLRAALLAGRSTWAEVLATLCCRIDPAALVSFAQWTTPPGAPKRYATRFYAARAPVGQAAEPDGREMVAAEWVAPSAALAEAAAGKRRLMVPTRATLAQLADYRDADSALAGLAEEADRE